MVKMCVCCVPDYYLNNTLKNFPFSLYHFRFVSFLLKMVKHLINQWLHTGVRKAVIVADATKQSLRMTDSL